MKTAPAANLPAIKSFDEKLKSINQELMVIPTTITEEWIRKRNNLTNEKNLLMMKVENLRLGKPELGYGDPIQTHGIPRRR